MPDDFDLPFDPGTVDDLSDLISPEGDDPTRPVTADPETDNVVPSPFSRIGNFQLSDLLAQEAEVRRNVSQLSSRSGNWQIDMTEPGSYAEGIGAIEQSMWIILSTEPGSQPMAPTFGSDIWSRVDQPMNIAAPLMAAQIKTDLERWEPRITIRRVRWSFQNAYGVATNQAVAGIRFEIIWAPNEDVSNERASSVFTITSDNTLAPTGIYFILATDQGEAIITDDGQNILIQ
jgi:phage baseplate assembly protein W